MPDPNDFPLPVVLDPANAATTIPGDAPDADPVVTTAAPADEALHGAYRAEIEGLRLQLAGRDEDLEHATKLNASLEGQLRELTAKYNELHADFDAIAHRPDREPAEPRVTISIPSLRNLDGTPAGRARIAKVQAHGDTCPICNTHGQPCIEAFTLAGYAPELYVELFGRHPPTHAKEAPTPEE